MSIMWFTEYEEKVINGIKSRTGKHRDNADYLICDECGHKESVDDDTFAKPWSR